MSVGYQSIQFSAYTSLSSLHLPPSLRSRSHSSDSSFEDDFGVRKEVLLHGSYDDYIKAYKSRSAVGSSSKAPLNMADVAAAYQKALSQVHSALQQQGSSSKVASYMYIPGLPMFFNVACRNNLSPKEISLS